MDPANLIQLVFYVCVATAAIFLFEAIYLAFAAPISRKRSVNRRLKVMSQGLVGEQAMIRLKQQRGILDSGIEVTGKFSKLLIQSGLRITIAKFFVIIIGLFLVILLVLRTFTFLNVFIEIAIALVLGIYVPYQIIKFIRARRHAAFTRQLPDALDVIVRSLRAGHPVPTALGLVGREMLDPVGTEFGLAVDEMTFGLEMPRALENLADRVGVPDLALLVTAVSIQSGSGGNLSEVLQNLSKVLRDRFQLKRKVRSLSAEGRFSAYGLIVLPILIFLSIYLPNPAYYLDAWKDPLFKITIVGLCFWSLIGNIIMYKMINFKF